MSRFFLKIVYKLNQYFHWFIFLVKYSIDFIFLTKYSNIDYFFLIIFFISLF